VDLRAQVDILVPLDYKDYLDKAAILDQVEQGENKE
jgi:hypothetical protein